MTDLPRIVVGFYAYDSKRDTPAFVSECRGAYDVPTYILRVEDGYSVWPQHMCREATELEKAEYWRNRCAKAEASVQEQSKTIDKSIASMGNV